MGCLRHRAPEEPRRAEPCKDPCGHVSSSLAHYTPRLSMLVNQVSSPGRGRLSYVGIGKPRAARRRRS